MSLSFFITEPTIVIELRHAGFVDGPAVLRRCASLRIRRERCVTTCMRVGLSHRKNGLLSAFALSMNFSARSRISSSTVSIRFGIQRAGVLDLLLADLAPARLHGRVVRVRRPAVDHVARTDFVHQGPADSWGGRVLHGIEVIEIAEELVEAVDRRQELVQVAKMVLAELAGGVAHRFECGGDRRRLVRAFRSWRRPGPRWSCRCGSAIRR